MLLQQLLILWLTISDGGSTQQVRQIAARVLHLVDLLVRPFAGGVGVWRQVIERAPDAATVFRLIRVKINSDPLARLGQRHQRRQVERRIAQRAGALQLLWLFAISFDLPRYALARGFGGLASQFPVADEERIAGQLRGVPTAVIVPGLRFVFAVRAGSHPVDELAEPRRQRLP